MKSSDSSQLYPLRPTPEDLKLTTWFRVNDAIEGILTLGGLGQFNLKELVDELFDLDIKLHKGININFQKTIPIVDTSVTIPTELGYPATIRLALPVTVSLRADLKYHGNLSISDPKLDVKIKPL